MKCGGGAAGGVVSLQRTKTFGRGKETKKLSKADTEGERTRNGWQALSLRPNIYHGGRRCFYFDRYLNSGTRPFPDKILRSDFVKQKYN